MNSCLVLLVLAAVVAAILLAVLLSRSRQAARPPRPYPQDTEPPYWKPPAAWPSTATTETLRVNLPTAGTPAALPPWLSSGGDYGLRAVGMSHYEAAFLQICGPRTSEGVEQLEPAELVLDPSNRYDANAVRVEIRGLQVGHLGKQDALAFRQRLARERISGDRFPCKAMIVGGWEGGNYGIHLNVALYG